MTPLDLAREKGYNDIVKLLEKGDHFCELLSCKICVVGLCTFDYNNNNTSDMQGIIWGEPDLTAELLHSDHCFFFLIASYLLLRCYRCRGV